MRHALRRPSEASLTRMGSLAKLPVFLDLHDKRAVLSGGGAAAAWKAELLAAAGARVEIYADTLSVEMTALIARGAASGELRLHDRAWTACDFSDAAVAVGEARSDAEAEAFYRAANAAGVPVNVIDMPAFCTFQFGSIVNRSPIVIGISTDGAAPILGQAVRRRIETLLPASLAAWGRLAKEWRGRVTAMLEQGSQRRAFWERFVDHAFGPAPRQSDRDVLLSELAHIRAGVDGAQGRVTLVGAGPGDAELLTIKAVRALQAADVILFDDLVSPDILELARREAKRIEVGKRGGRRSCAQDEINQLMLSHVAQGKHVVRLKSGDPMVFGRAGEEISSLQRAGIDVDVVPGITAALAMASSLGVSLTHRDCAQSLRLVTGHARTGALPADLDWRGLADPRTTTIFYMAGRTCAEIAAALIAHGLPAATPVCVMSSVSRPDSVSWKGELRHLEPGVIGDAARGAVIIGIGTVFASTASQQIRQHPFQFDGPEATRNGPFAA